jgi:hypothetical protein
MDRRYQSRHLSVISHARFPAALPVPEHSNLQASYWEFRPTFILIVSVKSRVRSG